MSAAEVYVGARFDHPDCLQRGCEDYGSPSQHHHTCPHRLTGEAMCHMLDRIIPPGWRVYWAQTGGGCGAIEVEPEGRGPVDKWDDWDPHVMVTAADDVYSAWDDWKGSIPEDFTIGCYRGECYQLSEYGDDGYNVVDGIEACGAAVLAAIRALEEHAP